MHSAERWTAVGRLEGWTPPRGVRTWWRSRVRLLALVALLAWAVAIRRGADVDGVAPSPEAALAGALSARGLACEAGDVTWIDAPKTVRGAIAGGARALVRARPPGEPSDLYLVDARLSPEGVVLAVGGAWDITETTGVDESRPLVRGTLAAYTTSADGLVTAVHVLDLAGRPAASYAGFTRLQRLQTAITNLQQTGHAAGLASDTFALDPVARSVSLAWQDDGTLRAVADDHTIVVDPRAARALSGESFVRVVPDELARPGNLVTWAVDRVRATPWFGDERMQWLKAVVFTAMDDYRAAFARGTTAKDVQDELGLQAATLAAPTFTDPEVGWPPAPLEVPIRPPLPGEGKWIALDRDPFITPTASGSAPAFVTSFLRPDAHRPDVRVYVTLWDPRQIALHMEAGAVEPVTGDGEHGPGLVPRTPEVMSHLVATFNGGFQPEHGEYGMQANGIDYLPPKPYAATVMEMRDGSTAFGAWPGPGMPGGDGEVPPDVLGFRQNLTALVQAGKFNPWGRTWWGGTPPGWPDQIHSARSAICLTADDFVGYFYSPSISAEDLAQALLAARCSFGIHLDMNPGHVGFEFYDVAPEGQLAPLGRPMQADWEAEGKVPDMPGWAFRARRMIRGMGHMLFPRWIHREARDFFYLTARPLLPGAPIAPPAGADPEPGEGVWRTKGLPQHGFPYALATTWVHATPGGPKLRVVRADPRAMKPVAAGRDGEADAPTVLALSASTRGALSLWWSDGVFAIAPAAPRNDAALLAAGYAATTAPAATARAAAGVQDDDGMLVWVELPADAHPGAQTALAMDALLARLGCSTRLLVPGDARALLGGSLDAAGEAVAAATAPIAARLVRAQAPGAHLAFESTPIVPISVWQPLQKKRIRYFYKPPPAASASASAPAGGAPPATSAIRVQSPR